MQWKHVQEWRDLGIFTIVQHSHNSMLSFIGKWYLIQSSRQKISVIITIPNLIFWFNSRLVSREICPESLGCSGTTPTHRDNHYIRPTTVGYLTEKLATVKNLVGTTCLRMGRLSTVHYVYILKIEQRLA